MAVFRDVRDRDVAGRRNGFIAEGEVVLRAIARGSRHRLQAVLIAEKRLEALTPVLEALGPGVTVYGAGQAVMDAVAGFAIHRGILGFGIRATPLPAGSLLAEAPPGSVVLSLHAIANHDNMGGIFRNAAAFGAQAILLDPTCCDPLYRKAIRVSVGAALTVPFGHWADHEDPIVELRDRGFTVLSLSPNGEMALSALTPPDRAALLLGAEGPGLPDGVLSRTTTVSIPMAGAFDSLNVATTSGIALHHLRFGSSRSAMP